MLRSQWRTATGKQRRIIYNDDGGAQYPAVNARAAEGREGFLAARFAPCVGSHVDSYFFCVDAGRVPAAVWSVPAAIGDANQAMIEACREAGIEAFASLRMNDTHDANMPQRHAAYSLKVERPDLLVAPQKEYPRDSMLAKTWSALDYRQPEVQDHRLEFIERCGGDYAWDGFELDFFRHARHFPIGEDEQQLDVMTAFVGRVRALLTRIGARRGRPYLLAARVGDTPALSRRLGLDTERWLQEGLLDVLVAGGGYAPYSAPFSEYVALGHRYGVPVYPCLNCSLLTSLPGTPAEVLAALDSSFRAQGADGLYLFNLFDQVDRKHHPPAAVYAPLHQIGDLRATARQDKLYAVASREGIGAHMAYGTAPGPLPVLLIRHTPIPLFVADPVERAALEGTLRELLLRFRISDLDEGGGVHLAVNGVPVSATAGGIVVPVGGGSAREGTWFAARLSAPPVRYGLNEVVISPGPGCSGRAATTVRELHLWVRYEGAGGSPP